MRRTHWTIYDFIVDPGSDSSTHKQWAVVELTADNRCMLVVTEDCSQRYQTLVEDTEICYQTSEFHLLNSHAGRAL
jgi:dTDP-4-dehydrorhamnose 3,5-epimerase-like enzyme